MKRTNLTKAAAVAVFAAVMVSATAAFADPVKPLISEQAVSTVGSTDGGYTDTYGTKVVYDEAVGYGDYDVWLFDSATMTSPKRISTSSFNDRYPKIYGDYVVYSRNYAGVYLYRISKGTTKTLVSSGAQSQFVDIYKNTVVYSKYSSLTKTLDVYAYDITTGKEKKIVSGKDSDGKYTDDRVQSIWGDNVVYVSNYKDLRVYNLASKKSYSLDAQGFAVDFDSSDARRSRPAIYQNTVAYVANADNHDQVFIYDLGTKVRTQVSQDATTHANPAVYGTRVVYESGGIGDPQLVMYDLKAKSWWDLDLKAMQPSIWGDRLGWSDLRNATLNGDEMDEGANWGNEDVYTGTLNTLKIAASSATTVGYNAVPVVAATVRNADGSLADTTTVSFEVSTDAVNWSALSTTETVAGSATVSLPPLTSKRYVRVWFAGNAAPGNPLPPTVSNVVTITPKVSLGTPVAPKTMKVKKSYNVYGSLKPRHTSGTKPVRIYKYKHVKSKGKWIWKSYGYTTAKAYNYSSYSRYKASIKLTSKGSWRVRAYAPADSKHAATWSAKYDYVKVK